MEQAVALSQSTPLQTLYLVVSVVLALSMASERLVEIVKGAIPWLNQEIQNDPKKEGWRKMAIQLLALVCALVTSFLARDALSTALATQLTDGQLFGLGILASGGSSLWNSVLVYLIRVKDLKEAQAISAQSIVNAGNDAAAQAKLLAGT